MQLLLGVEQLLQLLGLPLAQLLAFRVVRGQALKRREHGRSLSGPPSVPGLAELGFPARHAHPPGRLLPVELWAQRTHVSRRDVASVGREGHCSPRGRQGSVLT